MGKVGSHSHKDQDAVRARAVDPDEEAQDDAEDAEVVHDGNVEEEQEEEMEEEPMESMLQSTGGNVKVGSHSHKDQDAVRARSEDPNGQEAEQAAEHPVDDESEAEQKEDDSAAEEGEEEGDDFDEDYRLY